MKVLDATFLIDYLNDTDAATDYLRTHRDEEFVVPVPAYAETLVGEGNKPGETDIAGIRNALAWANIYDVTDRHGVIAAEIADEIAPGGPYLGGADGLIAAVGRELNVPVVTADGDLTHPETKAVIDVEEYKSPN